MKKIVFVFALISVFLTGCGSVSETSVPAAVSQQETLTQALDSSSEIDSQDEKSPETEAVPETEETTPQTEEAVVPEETTEIAQLESEQVEEEIETVHITLPDVLTEQPQAQPEPETEPVPETEPIPQKPDKGVVVNAYISAIQDKIAVAKQQGSGSGNFSVTYSLYDMDRDDVPELLLQYGTCEADFRIVIYTVRDNALKLISDDVGGGHTGFAYDYKANQLVLAQGHMGSGIMTWYDLDENGNLRYLIDSDAFQFAGDGLPEYEDVMKKYNVAWLNGATSSSIGGETATYVYTYSDYQYSSQEYDGLDFRYLQDYPF